MFHRRRLDEDLDQELSSHLELAIEANQREGMSAEEARREAMRSFGGIARTKETYREQRGLPVIETMLQDVRYGWRMLAKSPAFTAVAVLSLALGIGANTAIFTLIDAVLVRMLPVKNAPELVLLRWAVPAGQSARGSHWMNGNTWDEQGRHLGTSFSYPSYQQIRTRGAGQGRVLSDVFAFTSIGSLNVFAAGQSALASGQIVSANYFSVLGIKPAAGRMFVESDDRPGAAPVCVIGNRYWQRRFGGDPSIAGKGIFINGVPITIIGVTPPEFFGLQPGSAIDISLPLSTQPPVVPRWDPKVSLFSAGDHWWLLMMGRLNPGVSASQATRSLDTIFKQSAVEDFTPEPGERAAIATLEVAPGSQGIDQLRRKFSQPLLILMGMVGMVLLIACANVANLLLARATSRQKEIGVRLSLGAPRHRLIRQLLTESILLSCMGGGLGLALAWWGSHLLVALISRPGSPMPLDLNPNLNVLGFTAAICLVTGLLFGLAPAFRATQVDLTPALKRSARSSGGLRLGLGKMLVIAQAALSLVLLFGAGLFLRTLVNLEHMNVGFDKEKLLLFGVNASQAGYKGTALNEFYDRARRRVAALPGVISATTSLHLLLSGNSRRDSVWVPGYILKPGEQMEVNVMPAGPDFLKTMRIPLLRGRDLAERDNENAPKVAVVNETFVKRYFGDRDPIGERIGWEGTKVDMEIVGVAEDAKYNSLRKDTPATVYHPFRQSETNAMHFEVRTAGDPRALIADVRRALSSLDPNIPLYDVKTQTEQIDELLMQERLFAKLSSFFGLLALMLACVGLYGILSYAVARRTGEIGIRMALGARRGDIVSMVLRETLLVVVIGLSLGIPASFGAARLAANLISDLLYGLSANDVTTVVMAAAALVVVAAFAGFWPARRASLVDPMVALRHE